MFGSTITPSISEKLAAERRALLDLGLRNPLINFRPSKSKGVTFDGERSIELFEELVNQCKVLGFLHTPDPEESGANRRSSTRKRKQEFQTEHPEKNLQTRLLKTYRDANTYLAELGVNILYLAIGMLVWYEDENSSEGHRAPLILVPIELKRTTSKHPFTMTYTQEDLLENFALAKKLEDFGIKLPAFSEEDDLDPKAYLDSVRELISFIPRWTVETDVQHIGFFSFGKFMMYRDLDLSTWPSDQQPEKHAVIQALLGQQGFRSIEPVLSEHMPLDKHPETGEIKTVIDADSSQLQAILEVRHQRDLVIQGPPGTGKSQTITNLIADAIDRGQKVLFVSEKMAALEVVKRRLDSVGLGDTCLELHSHKTNKRELLKELERTLELGQPALNKQSVTEAELRRLREQLNDYADAVNTPISVSQVTPYQAYGELLRLRKALTELSMPPQVKLPLLSPEEYRQQADLVERYQTMYAQIQVQGSPKDHPFASSDLQQLLPSAQEDLRHRIEQLIQQLTSLHEQSSSLAQAFGTSQPENLRSAAHLLQCLRRISGAPDLRGVAPACDAWLQNDGRVMDFAHVFRQLQADLTRLGMPIPPAVWELDLVRLQANVSPFKGLPPVGEVESLLKQLSELSATSVDRTASVQQLSTLMHVPERTRRAEIEPTFALASFLLDAPGLESLDLADEAWDTQLPTLLDLVSVASDNHLKYLAYAEYVDSELWQSPLEPVFTAFGRFDPELTFQQIEQLISDLHTFQEQQEILSTRLSACQREIGLPNSATPGEVAQMLEVLALMSKQPDLTGFGVLSQLWRTRSKDLQKLINSAEQREALLAKLSSVLIPDAWTQDVLAYRQAIAVHGPKGFWKIFSGDYRKAVKGFRSLLRGPLPTSLEEQLAVLDAILGVQEFEKQILSLETLASETFGEHWQASVKDWSLLRRIAETLEQLHQDVSSQKLPAVMLEMLSRFTPSVFEKWQQQLQQSMEDWESTHSKLTIGRKSPSAEASWAQWQSWGDALAKDLSECSACRTELTKRVKKNLPSVLGACRKEVDSLIHIQRYLKSFETEADLAQRMLGSYWQGRHTDWQNCLGLLRWLQDFLQHIRRGDFPASLRTQLTPEFRHKLGLALDKAKPLTLAFEAALSKLPIWFNAQLDASHLPDDYAEINLRLERGQVTCQQYLEAWQILLSAHSELGRLPVEQVLQLLPQLVSLQNQQQSLESQGKIQAAFPGLWQKTDSDWQALIIAAEWVQTLRTEQQTKPWPAELLAYLESQQSGWHDIHGLDQFESLCRAYLQGLKESLGLMKWQSATADDLSRQSLAEQLQHWKRIWTHFDRLSE